MACLVAHLAELDRRCLHLARGFPSQFTYCTEALHLSEHAAYRRIEAARAARKFPQILDRLANGSIHLTGIGLLASHLTEDNHEQLLNAARHKTRREIEEIVARLRPLPPVRTLVRKVAARPRVTTDGPPAALLLSEIGAGPAPATEATSLPTPAPPPARVAPLAPDSYKIQFTARAASRDKLKRAQDLLRHQVPGGDVAQVFEMALDALIEKLERRKIAATMRPRPVQKTDSTGRHIPAAVKREVWTRDQGRCGYRSPDGRRCSERGSLEFHHLEPYAVGGQATSENLALRCRAHNQYEAQVFFGSRVTVAAGMATHRRC